MAKAKRQASITTGPPQDQPSQSKPFCGRISLSRIYIGTSPRSEFYPGEPSLNQSTALSKKTIQAQGRVERRRAVWTIVS